MTGTHEIEQGDGRTPEPVPNKAPKIAADNAPPPKKEAAPPPPVGKAAAKPHPPEGAMHLGKWIGSALVAVAAAVTLTKLQRKARRH
jgi:hypothetical protein